MPSILERFKISFFVERANGSRYPLFVSHTQIRQAMGDFRTPVRKYTWSMHETKTGTIASF